MQELFKIINENIDKCAHSTGASDELIAKAERYLGLKFPESYKYFLKTYGYLAIGGEEIYGIIDGDFEDSRIPDAIWLTKKEHERNPELKHLVVVYFTGDEFFYCLDTSRMNNGECPVVIIDVSFEGETEDVHDTFKEFVKDCIEIAFNMEL